MKTKHDDVLVDLLEVAKKLVERRSIPASELKSLAEALAKFNDRTHETLNNEDQFRGWAGGGEGL